MIIECRTFEKYELKIKALEELNVDYTVEKKTIPATWQPHKTFGRIWDTPPITTWTITVKELSTCDS